MGPGVKAKLLVDIAAVDHPVPHTPILTLVACLAGDWSIDDPKWPLLDLIPGTDS